MGEKQGQFKEIDIVRSTDVFLLDTLAYLFNFYGYLPKGLRMDLSRLKVLRELSRCGTMAAAADALYLSPSAVSQQITQLELEAGVTLTGVEGVAYD